MEGASRSPGRERCAGMSAAQKRKREGGDDGELVGAAPATKKVMNQGDAGTCVAYAFTLALSQGVDAKYGIAFDPAILVEKVKTLCPCWEGHRTERMPAEWNEKHADLGAFIEDVDKRYRLATMSKCAFALSTALTRRSEKCSGRKNSKYTCPVQSRQMQRGTNGMQ